MFIKNPIFSGVIVRKSTRSGTIRQENTESAHKGTPSGEETKVQFDLGHNIGMYTLLCYGYKHKETIYSAWRVPRKLDNKKKLE